MKDTSIILYTSTDQRLATEQNSKKSLLENPSELYFTMASSTKKNVKVTAFDKQDDKKSAALTPCGGFKKCQSDQKAYLTLQAYPVVVRQVGDVISFYSKITNLTNENIAGPIDFYISGSEDPIASIDDLPAGGFYDLLVEEVVDDLDVTRRFIVATVWARVRSSGCLLGNVAEASVSVQSAEINAGTVQFPNPTLEITVEENIVDIHAGVDIVNLSDLAINSLVLDFEILFGKDTELTYSINGLPSDLFIVEGGVLRLAPGKFIAANDRKTLIVTNVDKSINFPGVYDASSEFLWRLEGKATNSSTVTWVAGDFPIPVKK